MLQDRYSLIRLSVISFHYQPQPLNPMIKRGSVMKAFILLLICVMPCSLQAAQDDNAAKVDAIFDQYLKTVHPVRPADLGPNQYDKESSRLISQARRARYALLAQLKDFPTEAVLAAKLVLFERANSKQRYEMVSMLGDIATRASGELLHQAPLAPRKSEDKESHVYEELVRIEAVRGLGKMSRRTTRRGGTRIQTEPDVEPAVPGLVAYIIEAANDPAEGVRWHALHALADSREPGAVGELLNRLNDPSKRVRLYAACFLTEFDHNEGLPEMQQALIRLKNTEPNANDEFSYYSSLQMLIASFDRITGKSFGQPPMQPGLFSNLSQADDARKQFATLLNHWQRWWNPDVQ